MAHRYPAAVARAPAAHLTVGNLDRPTLVFATIRGATRGLIALIGSDGEV